MLDRKGDRVILRDVTLREGLDVPGVEFSFPQRLEIVAALAAAVVPEIEIVAPGKVEEDAEFAAMLREQTNSGDPITSGLIYAFGSDCFRGIDLLEGLVARYDLLMPLSPGREPFREEDKLNRMAEVLGYIEARPALPGVGFPHALHARREFLIEACREAERRGVPRITIFDTDGSADPFLVFSVMDELRQEVSVELFFHAHNDLGLATANSLAAVMAGVDGLDVTVNGLGDRAGNASLEQVAVNLAIREIVSGIDSRQLVRLSSLVEELSGIPVHPLAPVTGSFAFAHKSPGHIGITSLFEAFDPDLIDRDPES